LRDIVPLGIADEAAGEVPDPAVVFEDRFDIERLGSDSLHFTLMILRVGGKFQHFPGGINQGLIRVRRKGSPNL
jgi:hypothetical protein